MKIKLTTILVSFLAVLQVSCQQIEPKKNKTNNNNITPVEVASSDGFKRAYFASGCFWCVEAIYESLNGVEESISGYSGGHTKNPTYESSNTGKTGHAEAVEIIYNPNIISFKLLVDVYFGSQNISQVNGQGNDRGSQYRSIIFYQNTEEKNIIANKIKALHKENPDRKVAAEVMPFQKFWIAEKYHQDYERLHPNNSYIQNVSDTKVKKISKQISRIIKRE